MLSSVALLYNLQNILIIGQNNPTITCSDNGGGLHLASCHNCTIDGITWDGCGTKFNSSLVLKIENSSSIVIQSCTFKHSVAQAIVLSGMSGDVNINHCKFVNNTNYSNHGVAIQCSSNNYHTNSQLVSVNNCNFTNNSNAFSIIYIGQHKIPMNEIFVINNSYFYDNQGTSIYLSNQNLYIRGKGMFSNNSAENGSGIFATDHSNIIFSNHSNILFDNNTAMNSGGAIYLANYSQCIFEGETTASFENNNVTKGAGGSIGSYNNSKIIFKENSNVQFINNLAKYGGALISEDDSNIIFYQNCTVIFYYHTAEYGGAVYLTHHSNGLFTGRSLVAFQTNTANKHGGAIYLHNTCNAMDKFYNNMVAQNGARIFIKVNSTLLFEENSRVTFNNSRAMLTGGAISSEIILEDLLEENLPKSVIEINNISNKDGINLVFAGVSKVNFTNNQAADGGAIFND